MRAKHGHLVGEVIPVGSFGMRGTARLLSVQVGDGGETTVVLECDRILTRFFSVVRPGEYLFDLDRYECLTVTPIPAEPA